MQIREASVSNDQGQPLVDRNLNCYQRFNQKYTKPQKCCIYCCGCTVLGAAWIIPVVIFVVAPAVAQSTLDMTEIGLTNLTLAPCNELRSLVGNDAKINLKSPLPLLGQKPTLSAYTQKISTTLCNSSKICEPDGTQLCGGFRCPSTQQKTLLGTYLSPEMTLGEGVNYKNFTVAMDLVSSDYVINGLITPTLLDQENAYLILDAEDLTVSLMGIHMGGLHMRDIYMTCKGVGFSPDAWDIPNYVCHPENKSLPMEQNNYYYLECDSGKKNLTRPEGDFKSMAGFKRWVGNKIVDVLV